MRKLVRSFIRANGHRLPTGEPSQPKMDVHEKKMTVGPSLSVVVISGLSSFPNGLGLETALLSLKPHHGAALLEDTQTLAGTKLIKFFRENPPAVLNVLCWQTAGKGPLVVLCLFICGRTFCQSLPQWCTAMPFLHVGVCLLMFKAAGRCRP